MPYYIMPSLINIIFDRNQRYTAWWGRDIANRLIRAVLNLVAFQNYNSSSEIQIDGYMNIAHRQLMRTFRRHYREIDQWELAHLWGDTPEARNNEELYPEQYEDHLCLRRLFGELPYEVFEEEPLWLSSSNSSKVMAEESP